MKDNFEQFERVARKAANDTVDHVATIKLPSGLLTIWRSASIMPAKKIAVFGDESGIVCVPSQDFAQFCKMLSASKVALNDVDEIVKLFREASPSRRHVLTDINDVLAKYQAVFHPPHRIEDRVVFFCENLKKGVFERIQIDSSYKLTVEELGPGRKMGIR